MKLSPLSFYSMTMRECHLAIDGHTETLKRDYHLNFLAVYNATGLIQGGKKFKEVNPFKDEKKKKKPTKKERDETLEFLKSKI